MSLLMDVTPGKGLRNKKIQKFLGMAAKGLNQAQNGLVRRVLPIFHPIAASGQHLGITWLAQPYLDLMQSRMRVAWLKTQQIAAMQVIGKVCHQLFKALARRKEL